MKTPTFQGKHEIQGTSWNQQNDLNFTDDLTLLSHIQQQIQVETTNVAAGLNMHKDKS